MSRHHFCVPPPYSTLIGRITLCALLLAGGSGIAWDCFMTPAGELRAMNDKLVVANDVLTARVAGAQGVIRQESAAAVAVLASPAPDDHGAK